MSQFCWRFLSHHLMESGPSGCQAVDGSGPSGARFAIWSSLEIAEVVEPFRLEVVLLLQIFRGMVNAWMRKMKLKSWRICLVLGLRWIWRSIEAWRNSGDGMPNMNFWHKGKQNKLLALGLYPINWNRTGKATLEIHKNRFSFFLGIKQIGPKFSEISMTLWCTEDGASGFQNSG